MEKESCLGVPVTSLGYEEIINEIDKRVGLGLTSSIVAVNPEKIIMSQKNESMTAFMNQVTYPIPDGIGVIFASKINQGVLASRVTGIKMMEALLDYADKKGSRIFLYGAREEVVTRLVQVVRERFPHLIIAGFLNGYRSDEEMVVRAITESEADFLFVALGSPSQELWLHQHLPLLQVKVVQGVGGSFDILAGAVKRAPVIYQKCGLEWLYRLMREPNRFKRQLAIPQFFWQIIVANAKILKNKKDTT